MSGEVYNRLCPLWFGSERKTKDEMFNLRCGMCEIPGITAASIYTVITMTWNRWMRGVSFSPTLCLLVVWTCKRHLTLLNSIFPKDSTLCVGLGVKTSHRTGECQLIPWEFGAWK